MPYRSSDLWSGRATHIAPCLASGGVYIAPRHRFAGELLPRLSILTRVFGRFFSVALSLKSPSQAFHLHPCPVMLGLSSRYYYPATVRLTRSGIISHKPAHCNEIKKKSSQFDLILFVFVCYTYHLLLFFKDSNLFLVFLFTFPKTYNCFDLINFLNIIL